MGLRGSRALRSLIVRRHPPQRASISPSLVLNSVTQKPIARSKLRDVNVTATLSPFLMDFDNLHPTSRLHAALSSPMEETESSIAASSASGLLSESRVRLMALSFLLRARPGGSPNATWRQEEDEQSEESLDRAGPAAVTPVSTAPAAAFFRAFASLRLSFLRSAAGAAWALS